MGTGNFYNKNASKIYAALMSYERAVMDEDGNETDQTETAYPDEWECRDFVESLQDELAEMGYCKADKWDNERQFSGRTFAELSETRDFMGYTFAVTIKAVIRTAYYDGANLDWELNYEIDGTEYEDISDISELEVIQALPYWDPQAKGILTIHARNLIIWLEEQGHELIEGLEKVFEQYSTPLVVSARLSNGETWYSKSA